VKDLTIASVEALPCSVPLKQQVTQGLGSVTKRDTVVVKVTTAASAAGLPVCTHGCHTGLNFAASVHLPGQHRQRVVLRGRRLSRQPAPHRRVLSLVHAGRRWHGAPLEGPGLGVDVDEDYLRRHPLTTGPAWH
jgi:D-galactarolactone cycloisomerase